MIHLASNGQRDQTAAPPAAIEVKNLTVSYGPVPALLDVTLSIPAGQLVLDGGGRARVSPARVVEAIVEEFFPHEALLFSERSSLVVLVRSGRQTGNNFTSGKKVKKYAYQLESLGTNYEMYTNILALRYFWFKF